MKTIKIFASFAIASMVLSSCGDKLNVHNPNYFTDEEMQDYLASNPSAQDKVLSGLTASLYKYVTTLESFNAASNGGYSNSGAWEINKEFRNAIQSGDIIEGDAKNTGYFTTWYQNLSSNTYWETDEVVNNYGYYSNCVYKVGPAQKALDFLTAEYIEKNPTLGYARAQALTLKAIAYLQLMERYTDFDEADSETAEGWPMYDAYAYNTPTAPLSVKATWDWIMDAFEEAATLFHSSTLGTDGYTFGTDADLNAYNDIDCAVCQYFRCRAALDCKRYDVVISAGEDLLAHYPDFIAADAYGMPESMMAAVDRRDDDKGWKGEYNADKNAFLNVSINPEAIYASSGKSTCPQAWAYLGSNSQTGYCGCNTGLNTLKNTPEGYYQMDEKLYNSMSDNDCRKACFLSEEFSGLDIFTNAGTDTTFTSYDVPAYTTLKWAATCGFGSTNHDIKSVYANTIFYRSSAVLLMVAEAYVNKGNSSKAAEWLNKLLKARTIAGKPAMTVGTADLAAVQTQWRLEMWGESDWAFFNLKRWGKTSFTRGSNHWSTNTVPSSGWTWEIPQTERQGNPNWSKN